MLLASARHRRNATELLDKKLSETAPDVRDAALTTQIVYGTVRMQGALDWIVSQFSDRPVEKIGLKALMCLRIALYQLFYLDRIPDYAAVNESVRLAKTGRNPGVAAFVNAVLRKYIAGRDSLKFPAKEDDPAAYISTVHSHPRYLVERWINIFGIERTEEICRVNNIPAPLFVRTNTLKISRDDLIKRLENEGVSTQTVDGSPLALRLDDYPAPAALPSFRDGLFYVQDVSAMRAVYCLKPQQNEHVLDICAGPGGKTTFIAQQMQKHGSLVAVDSDPVKTVMIEQNLSRLGIPGVSVIRTDATKLYEEHPDWSFDRILVDVPCSNTGVLRRRVEARWRLTPEDFDRLAAIQMCLLDSAAKMLKKKGVLVYSTCSIDPAENEQVASAFLADHEELKMNLEENTLPVEGGADGGYIARFVRSS